MSSTMLGKKTLVGLTALLVVSLASPAALATDQSLARTSEGGCVLVDWTTNPYVVSPATGCSLSDPCVDVDWNAAPPLVVGSC